MNKLSRKILAVGVLAGTGYLVYTFAVNDDAKAKFKTAINTVKDAAERVAEVVSAAQGLNMSSNDPLANVQSTARQWEAMGY